MHATKRRCATNLDENGHEILSDKPIAMPLGMKTPESLQDQIRRLVKYENFAQKMSGDDADTFEEADDFDIGDDFDPSSPFEQFFDPFIQRDVSPDDLQRNTDEYKKLYEAAAKAAIPDPPKPETQPQTATTPESEAAKGDQ